MEKYKLYGELLTSYLYKISDNHIYEITLENYYEENKPITIPLDISISPSENAKKYFKKYHKLKNTYTIVQEQKQEFEQEVAYLESIIYEIQSAKSIEDLNFIYEEIESSFQKRQNVKRKQLQTIKKKNKAKNIYSNLVTYNIDGFQILVGKNNKQNDELTFKVASGNDIWFHVKDLHGSHVILLTNGKEPSQETINKVASIAAYHSKGIYSSNVPVDYTLVKYVKKLRDSRPGMVIFTNQKTVNVQPKLI